MCLTVDPEPASVRHTVRAERSFQPLHESPAGRRLPFSVRRVPLQEVQFQRLMEGHQVAVSRDPPERHVVLHTEREERSALTGTSRRRSNTNPQDRVLVQNLLRTRVYDWTAALSPFKIIRTGPIELLSSSHLNLDSDFVGLNEHDGPIFTMKTKLLTVRRQPAPTVFCRFDSFKHKVELYFIPVSSQRCSEWIWISCLVLMRRSRVLLTEKRKK